MAIPGRYGVWCSLRSERKRLDEGVLKIRMGGEGGDHVLVAAPDNLPLVRKCLKRVE